LLSGKWQSKYKPQEGETGLWKFLQSAPLGRLFKSV
jgi:hypothetical protein